MNTRTFVITSGMLAGLLGGGLWTGLAPAAAFSNAAGGDQEAYDAFQQKDYDKAAEALGSVLSVADMPVEARCAALFNQSMVHEQQGQIPLAIGDLDELLRLAPRDVRALNARGALKITQGDFDAAIADFDQAVEISPRFDKAFYNRALAHFRKSEFDLAIKDCDQAIALNPNYAIAYSNRGAARNALQQFDQAITDFEQALKINASDAVAYYGMGKAYEAKQDYSKALDCFAQVVRIDPTAAYGYNRLAWVTATCGAAKYRDGAKAVVFAENAVQLRKNSVTLDTLAAAQARKGDTKAAAATQREALKLLSEDQQQARILLGGFQKRLALYESGSAYAE
jgi:tetratricopeptide (TPR) repeat protein